MLAPTVAGIEGCWLLEVVGLSRRFGATAALTDVALTIARGEAHAIVGENGAGKSTLIKILSGNLEADAGVVLLDGAPFRPASPAAARRAGISVIHQELSIIPELTVAENLFLGNLPTRWPGVVDFGRLGQLTRVVLDRLGFAVDPAIKAGRLSISQQQMTEIAKSVASGARLIIMDEPTSSIGGREAERLWSVAADLKRQGTTIVFVSHKLEEVFANADRVTVLRDGRSVATQPIGKLDVERLVALMVGRSLEQRRRRPARAPGDRVLAVHGLTKGDRFADVSFEVREGEIVGFAGLVGAGRTEVMRCVFGIDTADAGYVELAGRRLPPGEPRVAIAAGIGLVPENRREQGLFLNLSILENMSMPAAHTNAIGVLRMRKERAAAAAGAQRLEVVARSLDQSVATLSGGNQQKVILARWLALEPRLLIVDEPTRGIDVGTKLAIHELLRAQAEAGRAIVLVSSELQEILALATRVLVMRAGRIVGELDRRSASEESIGALAIGA